MNAQEIAQYLAMESGTGPSFWDSEQGKALMNPEIQADQYGKGSLLVPGMALGYNESDETGESLRRRNEALAQAKRVDSNASFGGPNGALQFDRSKAPKWNGPDLGGKNFGDYFASLDENQAKDRMLDSQKVLGDDFYGRYTPRNNLKAASNDHASGLFGQTEKYMPSIISAIMAAGMSAGAGPLIGAALSGTLGPGGIANTYAMGEKPDWKKVGINAATSAAAGLIGGGMGDITKGLGFNIDPETLKWLQRARQAKNIYDMYNRGRG